MSSIHDIGVRGAKGDGQTITHDHLCFNPIGHERKIDHVLERTAAEGIRSVHGQGSEVPDDTGRLGFDQE
ncbi:MAG: hypothetical protein ACI9VM_000610 [Candidatus Azotimanducaceae bacterium]|jgi:hypothetical protein